ncbi:hypothetical protein [Aquimonas voraii]|uniref:Uncharacterized protein n=1 Tax=Aquimonas voraii TaxID=265719 RepID=A0A1G6UDB5_9GAMM|nr:hypothetical protein [Aquimonas voraii]SDD39224.1 hypothetical protein SAMN04488509_102280 [Aquimonas voraii]
MQLRVIVLTSLGACTAFFPALEAMDLGRPMSDGERPLVCLLQLVAEGSTYPCEAVQISPERLQALLPTVDWNLLTSEAVRSGLQRALREHASVVAPPRLSTHCAIESQYACACGARWQHTRACAGEDRCPICFEPCHPLKSRRVDAAREYVITG